MNSTMPENFCRLLLARGAWLGSWMRFGENTMERLWADILLTAWCPQIDWSSSSNFCST